MRALALLLLTACQSPALSLWQAYSTRMEGGSAPSQGFEVRGTGTLSGIAGTEMVDGHSPVYFVGARHTAPLTGLAFSPSVALAYFDRRRYAGPKLYSELLVRLQVELTYPISSSARAGLSLSHLSNAFTGDENPGADFLAFTVVFRP